VALLALKIFNYFYSAEFVFFRIAAKRDGLSAQLLDLLLYQQDLCLKLGYLSKQGNLIICVIATACGEDNSGSDPTCTC
jgi:hypothetical protein